MSLSGSLQGMSPQDLLIWISRGKKNGVLTFHRDDDVRNIFFQDGFAVGVSSSRSKHRLGALLLQKRFLSKSQLAEYRRIQSISGDSIGKLLTERKLITEEQLKAILQFQLEEIIFDVLTWNDGDFEFEERPLKASEKRVSAVNVNNLLLEGARRFDEVKRFMEMFNPEEVIFRRNVEQLPASDNHCIAEIWDVLSKPRTLSDIIEFVNFSEYEIISSLNKLMADGIIVRDEKLEQKKRENSAAVSRYIERARELAKLNGYHESLSQLHKAKSIDPDCPKTHKLIEEISRIIIKDAHRLIRSPQYVPKVRQSFTSLTPDKLKLSTKEGFVFSRIDGHTNVKSLRYLTNLPNEELYIILHKLTRMGLIYMDKSKLSGTYSSPGKR